LFKKNYSQRNIALALGRSVSTISEEIGRNSVRGIYEPRKAQAKVYVRRHSASYRGKKILANTELRKFVESHLLTGQSPEGISGRLRYQEKSLPFVSKNTVYAFLQSPYGKLIGVKLKRRKPKRKRKKVTQLKDRIFIDKRPKIIEKRLRVGDVEGDFIVSGRDGSGMLLVVVDRKLRVAFLEIIYTVTIDEVHATFQRIKQRFPEMITATIDNDILFQMHRTLASLLEITIYFCHPYHSWEKGGVENVNKVIRKFIPKGSDLSKYTIEEIRAVDSFLNDRFMDCLLFATPKEVLERHRKHKNKKTAF
jgi:IS30 family transposase